MGLARRPFFVLAVLSLVLLPATDARAEVKKTEKGMTYSIKVPAGWKEGGLLVVGFHGSGDTHGNFMGGISGMVPGECLLVVPEGKSNSGWDPEADVENATDLLKHVEAEYRPGRTIALGFSAGCYFAYIMAFGHPDLFQGSINCSGGLTVAPDVSLVKRLAFYVIHGDADKTNPFETGGFAADKTLESAGFKHKFEKLVGVGHTLDAPAVKRGFEWLGTTLDAMDKASDTEFLEKIKAVEKSLKDKDWEGAATGFGALEGASRRLTPRIAALAKPHVRSSNDKLALAAIAAAGRLGSEGVAVLKVVPGTNEALATAAAAALGATGSEAACDPLLALLKAKIDGVSLAAAKALGDLGSDAALNALVSGLASAEGQTSSDSRKGAIQDSLRKITGQSLGSSKEWKRWLAERSSNAGK